MKKHKLLYFLLLAIMVFISACGQGTQKTASNEAASSDKPKETAQQSEQPKNNGDAGNKAQETVKIGAILPYSGVYASLGENLTKGMELYFESVNWQAGGKKIELIKEDEENDPQASLRKFRKLVDQDKIDILTGTVSTAVAYALRDEVNSKQVPYLVAHAGGDDLTRSKRSDYIWRSSFNSWQIGTSMGQYAYGHIAKKVYLAAADYAFGKEVSKAFKKAFTDAGGEIVGEVYPPLGSNDYASYLTQIKSAKPEAVYSFFAGSDAVRFVKQYEQYGLKGKITLIGSGWLNAEDIRPATGNSGEGVVSTMFWDYGMQTPENKAFVDAYEKKYNSRPSIESVEGYDAARMIVEVFNNLKGDTSDKKKVSDEFGKVSFASPRGPLKLDPETHHVIQNLHVFKTVIKDGKTENEFVETVGEFKDPGK
ncbi:ABC transporter substrate-binding protein [Ferviditalea candida]|uniref:ABC transporter substrate-binding protein n=1 Tax=Ferviditalea candida TaxID=3108399 RepID=A0ABU5ZCC3_9BACL|nr:ABC transporter substrate-binding protein [Paenibacillaceae bacterium T2]